MKHLMRVMLLVLAPVAIGAPLADAPPQTTPPKDENAPETFTYSLKWKKGEKVRYKVVLENLSTHDVPAAHAEPSTTSNEGTLVYTEEVKNVGEDGQLTLVIEYEQLMARHPDGRPLNFSKQDLPRFERVIDKRGNEISEAKLSGPIRPQIVEYLQLLGPLSSIGFPPMSSVAAGKEWEITNTDDSENEKGVNEKTTFRLDRFEEVEGERCARIGVTHSYSIRERIDKVSIPTVGSQRGSIEGLFWVRVSDCRIVKAELNTSVVFDGKVSAPVGTEASGIVLNPGDIYRTNQTSTIKLSLVRAKATKPGSKT